MDRYLFIFKLGVPYVRHTQTYINIKTIILHRQGNTYNDTAREMESTFTSVHNLFVCLKGALIPVYI